MYNNIVLLFIHIIMAWKESLELERVSDIIWQDSIIIINDILQFTEKYNPTIFDEVVNMIKSSISALWEEWIATKKEQLPSSYFEASYESYNKKILDTIRFVLDTNWNISAETDEIKSRLINALQEKK